jgi:hypothetical protein
MIDFFHQLYLWDSLIDIVPWGYEIYAKSYV